MMMHPRRETDSSFGNETINCLPFESSTGGAQSETRSAESIGGLLRQTRDFLEGLYIQR